MAVSVKASGVVAVGGVWSPKDALVANLTGTETVSGLIVFISLGDGDRANEQGAQMPNVVKWRGTAMTKLGFFSGLGSNGGSVAAYYAETTQRAGALTISTTTDYYCAETGATYAFIEGQTGIGVPVGKTSAKDAIHPTGVTGAKSGSTILTHAVGIYLPSFTVESAAPGQTRLLYDNAARGTNYVFSLHAQDMVANGDSTLVLKPPYNQIISMAIEIPGGASTGAQLVKPGSIVNAVSATGTPLLKDPNKLVLAVGGLENTSALGNHELKKTQLVFWSENTTQHTISNVGVTVTRTDLDADYRISRGSNPVIYGEKKYFEITVDALASATSIVAVGVGVDSLVLNAQLGGFNSNALSWDNSGGARDNNTGMNGRPKYVAGDTIMVAVDMTEGRGWIFMGVNGVWYNGTQAGVNFDSGDGKVNNTARPTNVGLYPAVQTQNIGDKLTANFGRKATKYAAPTGFTTQDTIPTERPAQTLTMTGLVADASTLGAIVVKQLLNIRPLGLENTSTLGSPSLVQQVKPTGILSEGVTGSVVLVSKINISGLLGAASVLGAITVSPGKVTLQPSGIAADASSLGSPSIVAGKATIAATGHENASVLGSPTIQAAAVSIRPSGIASGFPFLGSPQVKTGSVSVSPGSLENTSSLGALSLKTLVRITVAGLENSSTLGGLTLQVQKVSVAPAGIWNQEGELGSLVISSGGVMIIPPGIANDNYLGNPKVNQTLSISGISNDSQIGSQVVAISQSIRPNGIQAAAEVLGTHALVRGKVQVSPASIVNTSEFGSMFVSQGQFARPAGIENISDVGSRIIVVRDRIYTETFDRPNENLNDSPFWTLTTGVAEAGRVLNNQLYANNNGYYAAALAPGLNQQVEYVARDTQASTNSFIAMRARDALNYIGVRANNGRVEVYAVERGNYSLRANSVNNAVRNNDILKFTIIDNILYGYVNNVQVCSWNFTNVTGMNFSDGAGIHVRHTRSSVPWIDDVTIAKVVLSQQVSVPGIENTSQTGSHQLIAGRKVAAPSIVNVSTLPVHLVWDKRLTHFHKVDGRWVPGTLHGRKDGRYRKVVQPLKKAGGSWS